MTLTLIKSHTKCQVKTASLIYEEFKLANNYDDLKNVSRWITKFTSKSKLNAKTSFSDFNIDIKHAVLF